MAQVHVVYDGRNEDLEMGDVFRTDRLAALGIAEGTELSSRNVTETQVKNALSQYYDVAVSEFQDHYVELNPNGNVTVRPNTKFGV